MKIVASPSLHDSIMAGSILFVRSMSIVHTSLITAVQYPRYFPVDFTYVRNYIDTKRLIRTANRERHTHTHERFTN